MRKEVGKAMASDSRINDEVMNASSWFGSDVAGFSQRTLDTIRTSLQSQFNAPPERWEQQDHSQYHASLMRTLGTHAGDPEKSLFEWLDSGTPTGAAAADIDAHGIFPAVDGPSAAVEKSKRFAQMRESAGFHEFSGNYQSFYQEDGEPAQQ